MSWHDLLIYQPTPGQPEAVQVKGIAVSTPGNITTEKVQTEKLDPKEMDYKQQQDLSILEYIHKPSESRNWITIEKELRW